MIPSKPSSCTNCSNVIFTFVVFPETRRYRRSSILYFRSDSESAVIFEETSFRIVSLFSIRDEISWYLFLPSFNSSSAVSFSERSLLMSTRESFFTSFSDCVSFAFTAADSVSKLRISFSVFRSSVSVWRLERNAVSSSNPAF